MIKQFSFTKVKNALALSAVLMAPMITTAADISFSTETTSRELVKQIKLITENQIGSIGVAASVIGQDSAVFVNGNEHFPMASTIKVPIAMAVMQKIDNQELTLDQLIAIDDYEWVFSPIIATELIHSGVSLSVANMLELMIVHSDNTAADVAFRLAGGPDGLTKYLASIGRSDIDASRYMRDLMAVLDLPTGREHMADVVKKITSTPELAKSYANPAYEADIRDQATPESILKLLIQLDQGEANISQESTDFLLGVMGRTKTGTNRLKAQLPDGVTIQHKTGTNVGVANDIGYITLPDGERVAIAVYTKGSNTPSDERELAIAEVGKLITEYYQLKAQ